MVRQFQSIIGDEANAQMRELTGALPDVVVACVGGGSNAMGIFTGFVDEPATRLVGVEPAGGAAIGRGVPGVVHGMRSNLMQDEVGQVEEALSISAGLDYPGVGPEHSYLASIGRAEYPSVTDAEVIEGFKLLAETEGIIPALECAHAVAWISREAHVDAGPDRADEPVGSWRQGRGADDGHPRRRRRDRGAFERVGSRSEFRAKRDAGRKLLVPYITGGYPGWQDAIRACAANGADAIEIGIPFSDPVMDGPVIQQASQYALEHGVDAGSDPRRGARRLDVGDPARRDDVLQPGAPPRTGAFRRRSPAGRDRCGDPARPAARGVRPVVRRCRRRGHRDDHARRADRARRTAAAGRGPVAWLHLLGRAARRDGRA